jgi:hypothetical protein
MHEVVSYRKSCKICLARMAAEREEEEEEVAGQLLTKSY